jgi:hypothetical protein
MALRDLPERFLVAFSFAGEQRGLVRAIAEAVEQCLGRGMVFYDSWFESNVAGGAADLKLQDIYTSRSELVAVCASQQYGEKPWTIAEWDTLVPPLLLHRTLAFGNGVAVQRTVAAGP